MSYSQKLIYNNAYALSYFQKRKTNQIIQNKFKLRYNCGLTLSYTCILVWANCEWEKLCFGQVMGKPTTILLLNQHSATYWDIYTVTQGTDYADMIGKVPQNLWHFKKRPQNFTMFPSHVAVTVTKNTYIHMINWRKPDNNVGSCSRTTKWKRNLKSDTAPKKK